MDGRSGMYLNYVHKEGYVRNSSGESSLTHEEVAGTNSTTSPKRRRLTGKTTTPTCHKCQKCFQKLCRTQFRQGADICRTCVAISTFHQCDGCKEKKINSEFQRHSISTSSSRGGHIVCKACQQRGLSRTNIQIYTCKKKGCQYGHLKFAQTDAESCICRVCEEEEAQKTYEAERYKAIKQTLKQKGAWQCTCKKKTDPNRLLRHQWHGENCTLYSGKVGVKRWPGKNKGITAEDLDFFDGRNRLCQICFRNCYGRKSDEGANICKKCVTASTLRQCDGCKEKKMNSDFHPYSISNASTGGGGYNVCKACQQRGLSRSDIQIYTCEKKGCRYGNRMFSRKGCLNAQLKFAWPDAGPRICRVCEEAEEAQKKDGATRESQ